MIRDSIGDVGGGGGGLGDHEDLVDMRGVAGVSGGEGGNTSFLMNMRCFCDSKSLCRYGMIHLPWSLYVVPLLSRPIYLRTTRLCYSNLLRRCFIHPLTRNIDHTVSPKSQSSQ